MWYFTAWLQYFTSIPRSDAVLNTDFPVGMWLYHKVSILHIKNAIRHRNFTSGPQKACDPLPSFSSWVFTFYIKVEIFCSRAVIFTKGL